MAPEGQATDFEQTRTWCVTLPLGELCQVRDRMPSTVSRQLVEVVAESKAQPVVPPGAAVMVGLEVVLVVVGEAMEPLVSPEGVGVAQPLALLMVLPWNMEVVQSEEQVAVAVVVPCCLTCSEMLWYSALGIAALQLGTSDYQLKFGHQPDTLVPAGNAAQLGVANTAALPSEAVPVAPFDVALPVAVEGTMIYLP